MLKPAKELAAYGGHKGGATDVAFLADEATLVAIDRIRGIALVGYAATHRRLMPVEKIHCSPDLAYRAWPLTGDSFATTSEAGDVRIWDRLSLRGRMCAGQPDVR